LSCDRIKLFGFQFWRTVFHEHGILEDGSSACSEQNIEARHRSILFNEAHNGNFVPRTVFADLDPDSLADVKSDSYGKIFRPEAFVKGSQSAGSIYASNNDGVFIYSKAYLH